MPNDLCGETKMTPRPVIICADLPLDRNLEVVWVRYMRHRALQLYGHSEIIRAVNSTIEAFFKAVRHGSDLERRKAVNDPGDGTCERWP